MNIQIIGIFIAIIGGIIVTKLLNLKIEKDSLEDKLDIINKQIAYDNERINKRKIINSLTKGRIKHEDYCILFAAVS